MPGSYVFEVVCVCGGGGHYTEFCHQLAVIIGSKTGTDPSNMDIAV